MKRNLLHILFISLGAVFVACSDTVESPFAEGMGELRLTAQMSADSSIPVITKAPDFSNISVEGLYIIVTNNASGAEVVNELYGDLLTDTESANPALPIALPVGSYTVKACTSNNTTVGILKDPYFEEVLDDVIIEEKKVSTAKLTCTFESIGVELALSEQFKAKLEAEPHNYSYEVKVSNGIANCTFTPEQTDEQYFLSACEELVVRIKVRLGSSNAWYPERVYRIKNNGNAPQLGEYYIITLDAGEEQEQAKAASLQTIVLTEKN